MKTTRFTMTVSAILAGVVLLFVVVTKANASTFSESFQVNGQKSSCVRTESTAGTGLPNRGIIAMSQRSLLYRLR
jgi:hypothetical protein